MAQPISAGMTQIHFSSKKKKWKLHSYPWKDGTEILTSCSFPHFLKNFWLYLSTMPVAMVQAPSRHGPQSGKLWSCCTTFDSLHGQCLFRKGKTTCGTCGWKMIEISYHMKLTWPTRDKAHDESRWLKGITFQAGLLLTSHAYKAKVVLDRILEGRKEHCQVPPAETDFWQCLVAKSIPATMFHHLSSWL